MSGIDLPPQAGVKELLFCYGWSMKGDRSLLWSMKDGFYNSYQVTGGLWQWRKNA